MARRSLRRPSRRSLRRNRFFRPHLEGLEARCTPAEVIFGNILKETFDDPSDLPAFVNGVLPNPTGGLVQFDDYGRVATRDPVTGQTTYQRTHPVFHHLIGAVGDVELDFNARDTNDLVAPGDTPGFLGFSRGSDFITFPDVDPKTEGVVFAALDVARGPTVQVTFIGTNGSITLHPRNPSDLSGPTFIGTGPVAGTSNNVGLLVQTTNLLGWDTLGVNAIDAQVNGVPLGMIRGIMVSSFQSNVNIDTVRVLIEDRVPAQFVMNDAFAKAQPGVPTDIDVTRNDQFPSGDLVIVNSVSTANLGTVTLANGVVTYTARPGAHGNDTFTYTVVDAQGNTGTGRVHVTVNTPPVGGDLTFHLPHGQTGQFSGRITVPPDPDGDPLTLSLFTDGIHGTATVNPDGSFTYKSDSGGVLLEDTFHYQVSDGIDVSGGAIHLIPANPPPASPVDDTVNLVHNYRGPKTIAILANDPYREPDGSTPIDPGTGDPLELVIVTPPANGAVHINPDNTITYTPYKRTLNPDGSISIDPSQPDPNGLVVADSFTYALRDTVEDQISSIATVRLVPDDKPPVARDFNLVLGHNVLGHAILINLLTGAASVPGLPGNDGQATDPATGAPITPATDGDGDPLHVAGGPATSAGGGQIQVVSTTTILFTPTAGTVADSFAYAVGDQYANSNGATIHVHWLSDPPQLLTGVPEEFADQDPIPDQEDGVPFSKLDPSYEFSYKNEVVSVAGDPISGDSHVLSYWFTSEDAFSHSLADFGSDESVSIDPAHGVLEHFVQENGAHLTTQLLSTGSQTGGVPGLLTVTAGSRDTNGIVTTGVVTLIWGPMRGGATYNVYRGTASGQETLLASGISSLSYEDDSAQIGRKYFYVVTPVNDSGTQGSTSNEVWAMPQDPRQLLLFNPDGSFRFASKVSEGTFSFTFQATDGFTASAPITVNIYVGGWRDIGKTDFSYATTDWESENFTTSLTSPVKGVVNPQPVIGYKLGFFSNFMNEGFPVPTMTDHPFYRIGPVTAVAGNLSVDDQSLQWSDQQQGDAEFLPANNALRNPNGDAPRLASNETLPTGEVTFWRQGWDGIVPSPPTKVDIRVVDVKSRDGLNLDTLNLVHFAIDPSSQGSLARTDVDTTGGFLQASFIQLPPGTSASDFPEGIFVIQVANLLPGGHVAVRIQLPASDFVTAYYKFGHTSDQPFNHWYLFPYDAATDTGAETHASNSLIPPNEIILHLVDGGRGDDDLQADRTIFDPGAAFIVVPGVPILSPVPVSSGAPGTNGPSPLPPDIPSAPGVQASTPGQSSGHPASGASPSDDAERLLAFVASPGGPTAAAPPAAVAKAEGTSPLVDRSGLPGADFVPAGRGHFPADFAGEAGADEDTWTWVLDLLPRMNDPAPPLRGREPLPPRAPEPQEEAAQQLPFAPASDANMAPQDDQPAATRGAFLALPNLVLLGDWQAREEVLDTLFTEWAGPTDLVPAAVACGAALGWCGRVDGPHGDATNRYPGWPVGIGRRRR
jgi:hypothetical protein